MAAKSYLFAVTHWLLTAGTILMLLITLLLALAEGGLFVALFAIDHLGIPAVIRDADLPAALDGISLSTVFALAIPAVGALMIQALLLLLLFRLIAKIVETAILGDPFVGENADRLNRIGFVLLGMEILGWVAGLIIDPVLQKLPEGTHIDLGFNFSPVGLVGILLIFVLAQVFRRGSEMRAELEATV